MKSLKSVLISGVAGACIVLVSGVTAWPQKPAPRGPSFESSVAPILSNTCAACHDPNTASGGLNIAELTASSITTKREQWEKVVRRVSA